MGTLQFQPEYNYLVKALIEAQPCWKSLWGQYDAVETAPPAGFGIGADRGGLFWRTKSAWKLEPQGHESCQRSSAQ